MDTVPDAHHFNFNFTNAVGSVGEKLWRDQAGDTWQSTNAGQITVGGELATALFANGGRPIREYEVPRSALPRAEPAVNPGMPATVPRCPANPVAIRPADLPSLRAGARSARRHKAAMTTLREISC